MKRLRIHIKPTRVSDLTFDEFYDEISRDWQHKAEALQIRRWRNLKRAMKGQHYANR